MATTYLSRTEVAGSTDFGKKFTVSVWFKKSGKGVTETLWATGTGGSDGTDLVFDTNDNFTFEAYDGSANPKIITDREFRDPGAWYHLCVAVDTTQATDTNRVKIYFNGVQETEFSTETYPAENYVFPGIGTTADTMKVGLGVMYGSAYWNGEMAHLHYTDGQVYAPTAFGETDATSGIWIPISGPSVTYGNNGMFLKFASGATLTDSSGNGNNMTLGGGTLISTKDNAVNNFCTMNPLENYYQSATFTNGNNTIKTAEKTPSTATIGLESGKWYCEGKCIVTTSGTDWQIGITSTQVVATSNELGNFANDWSYQGTDGQSRNNNTNSAYGNSYTTGDIIGIALDLTNSKLYFSKNGVWQDSGDPTSGGTGTGAISITAVASTPQSAYFIAAGCEDAAQDYTWSMNFGNGYFGTTAISSGNADDAGEGDFEYDVPAGYYAICTNNLGDQS